MRGSTIPTMKNLLLHYVVLTLPLLVSVLSWKYIHYPGWLFLVLLVVWCFIYHPFFTGRRLYRKELIPKLRPVFGMLPRQWFQEVYFKA